MLHIYEGPESSLTDYYFTMGEEKFEIQVKSCFSLGNIGVMLPCIANTLATELVGNTTNPNPSCFFVNDTILYTQSQFKLNFLCMKVQSAPFVCATFFHLTAKGKWGKVAKSMKNHPNGPSQTIIPTC